MRLRNYALLAGYLAFALPSECLAIEEETCEGSAKIAPYARALQQTPEEACMTIYNITARITTVQSDIRRIAGDRSDPSIRQATYQEKTAPNGLIDIAINRSFISDQSTVQVIPNRRKSITPITLHVRPYLERVADYSERKGYQHVEIVFYDHLMKYYLPTATGDGGYQIKVDTWQATTLCLTPESRICYQDVTKKVFWVALEKTSGGFNAKVDRVTAESPYEYEEFNRLFKVTTFNRLSD